MAIGYLELEVSRHHIEIWNWKNSNASKRILTSNNGRFCSANTPLPLCRKSEVYSEVVIMKGL